MDLCQLHADSACLARSTTDGVHSLQEDIGLRCSLARITADLKQSQPQDVRTRRRATAIVEKR